MTETRTREQWLADRQLGIGASESPVVLGLSPWKTRYQLWAEKCGLLEQEDLSENEAVEFGCRLEKPIAEAFADRTCRKVEMWPQHTIAVHNDYPWLICTPDAIQKDGDRGDGILQIKTTSAFNRKDWEDGPPLYYQVQTAHEMAVTDHRWGSLVVLIGGQKLRYYDLDRNDGFIAAMIPKLAEFWQLVQTRTPPPLDEAMPFAIAKVLAKLHPDDSGETIELPDESQDWTDELQRIKEELKDREERKAVLENRIKNALGDASWGLLRDGSRWSWRTQTRREYVVPETSFRVLRKVR